MATTIIPSADIGKKAIALVAAAFDHVDAMLAEFNEDGGDSGTSSRLIGHAAQAVLCEIRLHIERKSAEPLAIDAYDFVAMLDGARYVPDATMGGRLLLSAAHTLADAAATVYMEMPQQDPGQIAALKKALAASGWRANASPNLDVPENTQDGRQDAARLASYEIESIADVLLREISREGADRDISHAAPAMLRRMKDLSGVIMSVTGGDDGRRTSEMLEVVRGSAEMAA